MAEATVCQHSQWSLHEKLPHGHAIYGCKACGVLAYYRRNGFGNRQRNPVLYTCGKCKRPATRRMPGGVSAAGRMNFRCPSCP